MQTSYVQLTPPYVFCGQEKSTPRLSAPDFDDGKERFELLECQNCGVVRTEPLLSGNVLGEYYHASYSGGGEREFSRLAEWIIRTASRWRADNLLKYWMKMNTASAGVSPMVLDIRCDRGNLLRELSRLGCSCHSVERSDFPLDEHLNDSAKTIRATERILRPGGLFVIAEANFDSFQARAIKRHWFHLDLPRHAYHFSAETHSDHLDDHQCRIREVITLSLEPNLFGFIQSLFNMLAPFGRPRAFYRLLKEDGNIFSYAKLATLLIAAMFILPLVMAECIASRIFNNGAGLIVFVEKIE